jgi:hypothetical protein
LETLGGRPAAVAAFTARRVDLASQERTAPYRNTHNPKPATDLEAVLISNVGSLVPRDDGGVVDSDRYFSLRASILAPPRKNRTWVFAQSKINIPGS